MQTISRSSILVLTTTILFAQSAVAQSPEQKTDPKAKFTILRDDISTINPDNIVDRILSFDKDKKGKVTRNDLPERMQVLIDLGDTNKDGALDRDEIKKLVGSRANAPGFVAAASGVGRVRPSATESLVKDLKLTEQKKEQALLAVKAHEEHVRRLMEQLRADLMQKMKEILNEEEFQNFKAAMNRPRGGPDSLITAPDASRPQDKGRIDRLEKDPESPHREPRR